MEEGQQIIIPERPQKLKGFGAGGWLSAVQAGMFFAFAAQGAALANKIIDGNVIESIFLAVLTALIIVSIILFYRKRMMFRVLLSCHAIVLGTFTFVISNGNSYGIDYFIIIAIGFSAIALAIIMLFVSKCVKNTFCEQGRQIIKDKKQEIVAYNVRMETLRNAHKTKVVRQKQLVGLGGWLILFQIHIIGAACSVGASYLFSLAFGEKMNTETLILQVAISVIAVVCIVLFYKKKIVFRVVYIPATALTVILQGMNLANNMQSFIQWNTAILMVGLYALTIIALFKSKRVKNTFS